MNLVPKWGMGLYSRASQFSEIFQKIGGGTLLEGGILHASVRYIYIYMYTLAVNTKSYRKFL